ncbi:dihydroneopterin aldolase [Chlorobaculum limnaeum]|uniref:7,8-dihydroneopterin aldolase n=1 Tax=Chlorobaculum limnaeum TaxID=274537 RepID=A0A1D8D3X9_CHLLM|nr:dihydroneopterin aldolase [Chlorobaculum limnaeum]AOS84525.1 dihydroneopterin aldolase [Chlorobaculum limnaeum]
MKLHHRSCVRLVNAVFYARHGVHEEERCLGGRYEVDAEVVFDTTEAAATDDITKTVDYSKAYAIISEVMTSGEPAALIETLAARAAARLIEELVIAEKVTVRVRKRVVPLGGLCDYAEAEHTIEKR